VPLHPQAVFNVARDRGRSPFSFPSPCSSVSGRHSSPAAALASFFFFFFLFFFFSFSICFPFFRVRVCGTEKQLFSFFLPTVISLSESARRGRDFLKQRDLSFLPSREEWSMGFGNGRPSLSSARSLFFESDDPGSPEPESRPPPPSARSSLLPVPHEGISSFFLPSCADSDPTSVFRRAASETSLPSPSVCGVPRPRFSLSKWRSSRGDSLFRGARRCLFFFLYLPIECRHQGSLLSFFFSCGCRFPPLKCYTFH